MSLKHSKHLSSWEESIYDSKHSIKCRVTTSLTLILFNSLTLIENWDETIEATYIVSLFISWQSWFIPIFFCYRSLLQDFKSFKACYYCRLLIMWTNCLLVDNFNAGLWLAGSLTPGCDSNIDKVRGGEWPGPGWAWWTPQPEFCKLC